MSAAPFRSAAVLSGFDSIQVQGNLSVGGELKGFDEIRVSGAVMEVGSLIFDGSGDSLNLAVSDPAAPGMELPADSEARRDAIQNIADNYAVLKLDRLDNSAGGTIIVTFDGSLADVEWVRIRVIDYTGSPDAAVDYGDFRFAGSHGVLAVSDNDLYLVVEGVREHVVVASNYATISDAMIAIKDMSYEAGIVEQPALISVETGRHVLEADDVIKNCRISGEGEEGAVLTAAGSLYLGSHWVTLDHLAVEFSGDPICTAAAFGRMPHIRRQAMTLHLTSCWTVSFSPISNRFSAAARSRASPWPISPATWL